MKKWITATLGILLNQTVFAIPIIHPLLSFGGGAYFSNNVGSSQTFPIQNPDTDQFYIYSPTTTSQTQGLFNVFMGAEWQVRPDWLVQTGFDYTQANSFYVNGMLTQGADVESEDTYTYHYNMVTRQLLWLNKLLYIYKERYHPYVLAGVGVAYNQANNFSTTTPPFLTFTKEYQANNITSFSYAVGLGIDVDLNANFRVGIGYRFTDLGQIHLGSSTINTIPVSGTLSQDNLYANQLLVQLTLML